MTPRRVQLWLLAGAVAATLALWALSPRAGVRQTPKTSLPRGLDREAASPELPTVPVPTPRVSVLATPASDTRPKQQPGPATPVPIAASPRSLRLRGPWSYLQNIPNGLGEVGREEAIRRTAIRLSIDAGSLPAFKDAARRSVSDLERALAGRQEELRMHGSETVPAFSQSEWARQSEERYAAVRSAALARMEPFLGQTAASIDFRQGFDSWASLVASKARVVNR